VSKYDDPGQHEESEQNAINPSLHKQSSPESFNPLSPLVQSDNNPFILRNARTHQSRKIFGQIMLMITLLIIAFLSGWFGHLAFANSFDASNQSQLYAHLIQQAWTDIDQNYVDRKAVNYKQMSYQAINAMLNVLGDNSHTRLLTPADVQTLKLDLSKTFTGFGIYLRQDQTNQIIITSTIPDSPAEKAGLKRGDIIVAVNGVSIAGKDYVTVHSLIHQAASKSVDITVQRLSTRQTLTLRVTGPEITEPNVILHHIVEDHIAHIQIVQLANGVSSQLKDALSEAKGLGATSIILDLRDDPGGYVQEAINIASEFMTRGNALLVQDSKGQRTPYVVGGNPVNVSIPIVVLVNSDTASAAEILSGALQDNNRAIIVGTTTFGTGTVLQEFDLADGSAILLATEEWLTPKGHSIRGLGITPNIDVSLGANSIPLTSNYENAEHLTEQRILSSGDTQMAAAIRYLETHHITSTGPSQGKLLQLQPQATGLLAIEPSIFFMRV
jgi:carboxyl-terminal processing protease